MVSTTQHSCPRYAERPARLAARALQYSRMRCDGCGLEFERAEMFRSVRRLFRSAGQTLCPHCVHQTTGAIHGVVFWTFLAFNAAGLLLLFAVPDLSLGTLLLNLGAFQFLALLCTVAHEAGHALAGSLAGFRVFGIELGLGRVVREFVRGGVRFQFRAILFGGMCCGATRTARGYRWRETVFIAGGPLANIGLLMLGIHFVEFDDAFAAGFFKGFMPVKIFILANAVLLLYSLFPYEAESPFGKLPNDALLFWRTWRWPEAELRRVPCAFYLAAGRESFRRKNYADAQRWCDDGLRRFPDEFELQWLAANNLIFLEKYRDARRALVIALGRHRHLANLRALALNAIAWSNVLSGDPELLAEAETFSRRALEELPASVYTQGTRGSVLVELGRLDEGTKLLVDALPGHPDRSGQALNACYLGIAEARRGRAAESRNYFTLARRLDPHCVLLARETVKS